MSEKLKPCPFCGGTNIHIKDNLTWSYICCYDCLASFWQQEACDVEDNIEAWNRRAEQLPQLRTEDNILGGLTHEQNRH